MGSLTPTQAYGRQVAARSHFLERGCNQPFHTTAFLKPTSNLKGPPISMKINNRTPACAVVAATLLAAAVIAACGASSGGGVAHLNTSTASANPSNPTSSGCSPSGCSSSSASALLEAKALKYAGCMRSHGLTDFPDPTVGSNGLPSFTFSSSGNSDNEPNSPEYQSAQKACKNDLPNLGEQTPAEKAAANTEALKYVACMRSHGEPDFPDPNGQGVIKITNPTGILEPNSPQYLHAANACQSLDKGFGQQSSSSSRVGGGS